MTEPGEETADDSHSVARGAPQQLVVPPPAILNLGIFFDGTGNNLANARGGTSGSYANARSNVAWLSLLYPNDEQASGDTRTVRRSLYLEGIGTRTGGLDDPIDSAFGQGDTGVSAQVHRACCRLAQMAASGRYSRIVLDVFGFSRGAASARFFVNCVNRRFFEAVTSGIAWIDGDQITLDRVALPAATVRFVGVFDTVAAIGPTVTDAGNLEVNVHLRDGSAQAIYHIVAGSEYRLNFASNSLRSASGSLPAGAIEFVMPGAHSDIGGGYHGEGETVIPVPPERGRYPTRAAAEAARASLDQRFSEFFEWAVREHFVFRGTPELYRGFDALNEDPYFEGLPWSYDGAWVWRRPRVRTGIEKITLRLMHDQACSHDVPFAPLPADRDYVIPGEINDIYEVLRTGRGLSTEQRAFLRDYTHMSAHYTRMEGADRSYFRSPDAIDSIWPMEPAPQHRRIVHPNDPSLAF